MNFRIALSKMKEGYDVKLPSWSGFWRWEEDTIIMYTKDHERIPLLETDRPEYTFDNMASEDFEIATTQNSPILREQEAAIGDSSGENEKTKRRSVIMKRTDGMSFEDALEVMKEGTPVKRPKWDGYWEWEKDGITMHTEKNRIRHLTNISLLEQRVNSFKEDFIVATEENCILMKTQSLWDKFRESIQNDWSPGEKEACEGSLRLLFIAGEPITGGADYNESYIEYNPKTNSVWEYQSENSFEVNAIPWDGRYFDIATENNCLAIAITKAWCNHQMGKFEESRRIISKIPNYLKRSRAIMDRFVLPHLLGNYPEDGYISIDEINRLTDSSDYALRQSHPLNICGFDALAKSVI